MNVNELFSLKDKIALVTGGAGKYGRGIVEGLAEAGATVIIASRDSKNIEIVAQEFQERDLRVYAHDVDQGDHLSVKKLKEWIKQAFGRLDIFVNNAVARPMKGYKGTIQQFDLSMKINATGMYDILHEMIGLIQNNSKGGSIINIASMMGMFGPDLSNYEGTDLGVPSPDYFFHNGGLINLTKYLARVLGDKNIRVNTISPGGLFNHQQKRFLENYCSKVPLGRMANHDDIKGLVVLLASEAGAYINGENILMDGGLNA